MIQYKAHHRRSSELQMSKTRKPLSIKHTIIIVFETVTIISALLIIGLLFSRWTRSAQETSIRISSTIARDVSKQIISFMEIPLQVNDENHKIIENGILSLENQKLREKFFTGTLASQTEQIYSFSIGTVNGEYYGARRNEVGEIEIMRNNASTGGHSWYYSINDDLTASDIAVKLNRFDPRTREWYKAALSADGPSFSPVYQHFVMNDLTISAAIPVQDHSNGKLIGVMGSHMLLGGAGEFLAEAISEYDGYAFIVEKESGYLIANSMGLKNFIVHEDKTSQRLTLDDIENTAVQSIGRDYSAEDTSFVTHPENIEDTLYVSVRDINLPGIKWMVITAVPEAFLFHHARESIGLAGYLVLAALLLSIGIYYLVSRNLWKPMDNLLSVAKSLSAGNLNERVRIVRKDEIGTISEGLNLVADKMQYLINNLEKIVDERTGELNLANSDLDESRIQLQTLLDSTAEGIFGIDLEGRCTFLNRASLRLLGYSDQSTLLGERMHDLIHHRHDRDTDCSPDSCPIITSIRTGRGYSSEDDVFRKADGKFIDVAFHSYPLVRDGEIAGGVITFLDITEKKEREKQIEYLRCHDSLTGLLNRSTIEELFLHIDTPEHYPLSVIFGDLNGLKMTNDLFGHATGDALIAGASEVLSDSLRSHDIAARIGGDEFLILLPHTTEKETEGVIAQIKSGFKDKRIDAIKYSMALGYATKKEGNESVESLIAIAEDEMYKDKAQNKKDTQAVSIATIREALAEKKQNSWNTSPEAAALCDDIGKALRLPKPEREKLQKALLYHDIGMITLEEHLFRKEPLTAEEFDAFQMHPVMGYRILNLFDDMLDIAEIVYTYHEHWDGSGIPRGLKGEKIPLLSRVLAIIEMYDYHTHVEKMTVEASLEALSEKSGTFFDPSILQIFFETVSDIR